MSKLAVGTSAVPAMRSTSTFHAAQIMIGRCLRLSARNLEVVTTAISLPVILLLLFVYLFGGAIATGTKYINFVVPGVLMIAIAFSIAATAVSVSQDMTNGIIDRLRSMNVNGVALMTGHVATAILRNVLSSGLVIGVALLIGYRPKGEPLAWLAAAGMVLLFITTISWVAAIIGLWARSPEAASGFAFFIIFLPYASSALVPIATMPSWLQGFARNQPITPINDTIRGLLSDLPIGDSPMRALIWCGGILIVSIIAAGILFHKRTA